MLTCIELHFVEYTMDPAVKRRCQLNNFHFQIPGGSATFDNIMLHHRIGKVEIKKGRYLVFWLVLKL